MSYLLQLRVERPRVRARKATGGGGDAEGQRPIREVPEVPLFSHGRWGVSCE